MAANESTPHGREWIELLALDRAAQCRGTANYALWRAFRSLDAALRELRSDAERTDYAAFYGALRKKTPPQCLNRFYPARVKTADDCRRPGRRFQATDKDRAFAFPWYCCAGVAHNGGEMAFERDYCHATLARPIRAQLFNAQRPALTMADALRDATLFNDSIAFFGDSTMHQLGHMAECSWLRGGVGRRFALTRVVRNAAKTPPPHRPFQSPIEVALPPHFTEWLVPLATHTVRVRAIMLYALSVLDNTQQRRVFMRHAVDELLRSTSILIVNFGVHYPYHKLDEYRRDLTLFFMALRPWLAADRRRVAVWREQWAQHGTMANRFLLFSLDWTGFAPAGLYVTSPGMGCLPLCAKDDVDARQIGWRDRVARDVAARFFHMVELPVHIESHASARNLPRLYWMPIYNYTAPLFAYHSRAAGGSGVHDAHNCDASHYCSSPFFAELHFHMIASAILYHRRGEGYMRPRETTATSLASEIAALRDGTSHFLADNSFEGMQCEAYSFTEFKQ